VVWDNKPTSTGGDDPEEIHYQKGEVQRVVQRKNHLKPKASIHPSSLAYKRELDTKEKYSLNSLRATALLSRTQPCCLSAPLFT
jgi:hypothetical protein